MTPRESLARVAACIAAERAAWTLAATGFEHPTTVNDDATDAALAALEAALPDDAPAAPDDAERALRIRNLIAEREFNTACANRELTQFGEWRWDHEAADREIEAAIARLLAPDGAGEVAP